MPAVPSERATYERELSDTRVQLGERAFQAASAEGRVLTLEQAIAEANAVFGSTEASDAADAPDSVSSARRTADRLTPRQAEVLRLVAEGKSDRQIAAELVLSERTVGRHLENILARHGVSSRAAGTVIAVRQGLA